MKYASIAGMPVSNKSKKKGKPKLSVSVYASDGDGVNESIDDKKWLKEDLKRAVEDVAKYEKIIETWVPEDIAAKAKKEVEEKLAECKIRVRELKARIKVRS